MTLVSPTPHLEQVDPPHPLQAVVKPLIAAAVVVCILIAIYAYLGRGHAASSAQVLRVTPFSVPTTFDDPTGSGTPTGSADQLLVVVQMKIENLTNDTLTIQDFRGVLHSTGPDRASAVAGPVIYDKVFTAYPPLQAVKTDPLQHGQVIPAHQSAEGSVILNYPISKNAWDLRRGLTLTIDFYGHPSITVQSPG